MSLEKEKVISAADANRSFSKVLPDVRDGVSYIVTSHGRPVARIAPVQSEQGKVGDSPAWGKLLRRLKKQPAINIGRWKRDELYD